MEQPENNPFQQALALHNIWLKSLGKDGQQISLLNQDLSAVDWTDLSLSQAQLWSCIFYKCDLAQMSMNHSYMGGSVFITCKMTEIEVVKADFPHTAFRWCDLGRARFFRTNLNGADFRDSDLQEVDLRNTDLNATDFRWTNLRKAQFTKAVIDGTQFHATDLRGATGFDQALVRSIDIGEIVPEVLREDEARNWLIQKAAE